MEAILQQCQNAILAQTPHRPCNTLTPWRRACRSQRCAKASGTARPSNGGSSATPLSGRLWSRRAGSLQPRRSINVQAIRFDNYELLVGDALALTSFCLYKQITAIILSPSFPGWLAPLKFNPTRLEELISFILTICSAWVIASLCCGGYRSSATADLPTALTRVSASWLISMPVAACQLVLLTAVEDGALVGTDAFASHLPLAATGPGEPIVTAAGVLGLMATWRCFYAAYLDFRNVWTLGGSRINRYQDMASLTEAVRAAVFLSLACCIVLAFLSKFVGEEALDQLMWPGH